MTSDHISGNKAARRETNPLVGQPEFGVEAVVSGVFLQSDCEEAACVLFISGANASFLVWYECIFAAVSKKITCQASWKLRLFFRCVSISSPVTEAHLGLEGTVVLAASQTAALVTAQSWDQVDWP